MKQVLCALTALVLLWGGIVLADNEKTALTGLIVTPDGTDRKALFALLNEVAEDADMMISWEEVSEDSWSKEKKSRLTSGNLPDLLLNAVDDEDVLAFLYVLIDNNRINLLNDIIEAYKLKDKEKDGIIVVTLKSSRKLNEKELENIKSIIIKKFFGDDFDKELIINEVIDPSLLKGLVIEYQNKILDASLIDKQVSLKEYLEK